jgi:hypothetical protein
MTQEEIQELNELAHIIAYDTASGVIESAAYALGDGWLELGEDEDSYLDELRYLELRGLLVRNPDNPQLLKILPAAPELVKEATA